MPAWKAMAKQVERRRVHRSREEIDRRISKEARTMSHDGTITAPDGLLPSEEEEYYRLAEVLSERTPFDPQLDADTLARYIKARRFYLALSDRFNVAERNGASDTELARVQRMQDSFSKQCRACAQDLGLTVTARARLEIPSQGDDGDYEL